MTRTGQIPLTTIHDERKGEKQRFVDPEEAREYVQKRREDVAASEGQRSARKIVLEDEPDAVVYEATIRRYTREDDHLAGFYLTEESLDGDVGRRYRKLYIGQWKKYAGGDANALDGMTIDVAVLNFGATTAVVPADEIPRPVGEDHTPLNLHSYRA